MTVQPSVQIPLPQVQYETSICSLEQAIEVEPENIENYFLLGIALILLGQEEEAQTVWLCGISQVEEEEILLWTAKLGKLLEAEAQRQSDLAQFQTSWLLRQHLREFAPTQINNFLQLLQLELQLNKFTPTILSEWQIIQVLQQSDIQEINQELLLSILAQLIKFSHENILVFAEACVGVVKTPELLVSILFEGAHSHAVRQGINFYFAAQLLELVVKLSPNHRDAWRLIAGIYRNLKQFEQAIKAAKQHLQLSETKSERYTSSCLLESTYLNAGMWDGIEPVMEQNHILLQELIEEHSTQLDFTTISYLISDPAHFLYLQDNLAINRQWQNQVAQLFFDNIQANFTAKPKSILSVPIDSSRPLRVGFIAQSLYDHSVGWLSRWLIKHLDRQTFDTSIYLVNTQLNDPFFQQWFGSQVNQVRSCSDDIAAMAEQIAADQVDILIDLEGQTLDHACSILALKPAPIQATWLGWDATGLPSVDYFIADPYVLPEHAQEHYTEKIWRLPQTYIAVEGFEVGVPDLRRDDLKIPVDAIVYLTCQASCKRHPDSIRLQMQILQQVPESYLLIKGQAHTQILQDLFCEIAEREGVSPGRLRFLPQAPSELVHRANLQIADVVLDTFPYNGATTTLETLWMGIPVITRVGGQFTARYGYTLLTNAGLTEGIAWSDEEYIAWGIRYGTDACLRQRVVQKLRESRHNAHLWNARKFAREMENAFQQMWQIYNLSAVS